MSPICSLRRYNNFRFVVQWNFRLNQKIRSKYVFVLPPLWSWKLSNRYSSTILHTLLKKKNKKYTLLGIMKLNAKILCAFTYCWRNYGKGNRYSRTLSYVCTRRKFIFRANFEGAGEFVGVKFKASREYNTLYLYRTYHVYIYIFIYKAEISKDQEL